MIALFGCLTVGFILLSKSKMKKTSKKNIEEKKEPKVFYLALQFYLI
jgi:hypothetical protein